MGKLAASIAGPAGLESVWVATKCFVEDNELPLQGNPLRSDKYAADLIPDLRAKILSEDPINIRRNDLMVQLGLPANFDTLMPVAKTFALGACGAPEHLVTEFMDTSARINILRTVQGSLRSVASGLNSYLRFCNTFSIIPFPVTPCSARRWGAVFHPGKTFAQYSAHLRKSCILLRFPNDWFNEEIKTISRGLRNAQDRSFVFPNFLMSSDLLRITKYEWRFAPMAILAYLSYLFSLRVPSETLRLEKAARHDKLLTFEPQQEKALIGPATLNQTPVLVIKFRFRKNIRGGRILIRPCLCAGARSDARALCPVHGFWEHFGHDLPDHAPLIHGLSGNPVNRHLKAIMAGLGYLRARKYSPHAFRKGATQEISASGSTLATIIKSGAWAAGGYRGYLDIQADEAVNISALLLETANSDSEDDDPGRHPLMQTIRGKLPKVHMLFEAGHPPSRLAKAKPLSDEESSVISDTSESESILMDDLS